MARRIEFAGHAGGLSLSRALEIPRGNKRPDDGVSEKSGQTVIAPPLGSLAEDRLLPDGTFGAALRNCRCE